MTCPDIDTLDTLGGAKTNYAPVEDPTTDLDADEDNIARTDVAMMTHTACRAWAKLTLAATTGAMTLDAHDAMWGSTPGVAPVQARSTTGIYTLTFPTTVLDELGVAHAVNLRGAHVNVRGTTFVHAQCAVTAGNVVTIYTFNTSHAAADSTAQIDVFAL